MFTRLVFVVQFPSVLTSFHLCSSVHFAIACKACFKIKVTLRHFKCTMHRCLHTSCLYATAAHFCRCLINTRVRDLETPAPLPAGHVMAVRAIDLCPDLFQDEAEIHLMGGGHEPAGGEGELATDDVTRLSALCLMLKGLTHLNIGLS